jgi:predicted DCC family thiol-disulfide oxidoreductase YuxK
MGEKSINTRYSAVILFDGVCNLCNGSVQFVIKRDKKRRFRYATLQGEVAQKLLAKHPLNPIDLDSFILIEGEKIYLRSSAALRVAKQLSGLWPLLYVLIVVPKPLRDAVYNFVGKNRYKWFGQRESCMMPTPETKSLFL